MIFNLALRKLYPKYVYILIMACTTVVYGFENLKPQIFPNNFLLKQKNTGDCLVVLDESEGCPSKEGRSEDYCFNSNRVVLEACNEETLEQRWVFDFENKRIHSPERRTDLCLTRLSHKLSMETCQTASMKQLWFFDQQDNLFSRVDFHDPLAFVKLLQENADAPSVITFSLIKAESGNDQCYMSPFTGRIECSGFEIDAEALKRQEVEHWSWSGYWPWQPKQMKLTEDLKLGEFHENRCLAVDQCHVDSVGQYDCFGGARVQVRACKSTSHQIWRYDLVSKRLFNKQAGEQFCVSWVAGKLTLEHCLPGNNISQEWYFARGIGGKYSEKGQLRWLSNYEKHYDYIKALDFDLVVKFEVLNKDMHEEGCGYDPIDGRWKGQCTNN